MLKLMNLKTLKIVRISVWKRIVFLKKVNKKTHKCSIMTISQK